jgi:asparagine synthase (glutamine-hydrolysing)
MSTQVEPGTLSGYRHRGLAVLNGRSSTIGDQSWSSGLGAGPSQVSTRGRSTVISWGGLDLGAADPAVISIPGVGVGEPEARNAGVRVPPLGVIELADDRVTVGVDSIGFAHLYLRELAGVAAVSTSARALGLLGDGGLCRSGVAAQVLLGWQLGTQTLFADVQKVPPGAFAALQDGVVSIADPDPEPELAFDSAAASVQAAAATIRTFLNDYLDEHPDAELQLTGGLDSRILLAAVPQRRRRDLNVMTLTVPDSDDTAIAAELAERYGMRHRQATFAGLADLDPATAFRLCLTAARRVDSAADPLALAAVDFAELSLETRPRIGGLGGEVARGFYYFGPVRRVPVTRARVSRLARWRMFTNEAAPAAMLTADFASWAAESVIDDLYGALETSGSDWFRATDEIYLGQRMHRWAGVLASANALERPVVNPMLQPAFLALARAVPPEQKKNARFLSQVLLALDPELGDVRMDGRPPPATYASPSLASRVRLGATMGGKIGRKVQQRLRSSHRPPEGGAVLAELVIRHLRAHPDVLAPLRKHDFLDAGWLDRALDGSVAVEPSAVALLVNLLAAGRGEH